jgi:hypothetical protein
LRNWLIQNGLALITSYDVTQRDRADKLQPYNLQVKDPDTGALGAKSVVGNATPLDVSYIQFIEGDALRAFRGSDANGPVGDGRRIIGEFVGDTASTPWFAPKGAPAASMKLGSDGSMAAFVPAQKPLSWQLIDSGGVPVVRERYWVSFAAGEIRTCPNCHGINTTSQTGAKPPMNEPDALRALLTSWKTSH